MDSSPPTSPNPDPIPGSPDTPQPPDKAGDDTNSAAGSVMAPPPAVPSSTAAIEIGVLGKVETLSEEELVEYQTCEAIVTMAWQNFAEAGLAFARIRDLRLYRTEFKDFNDYCRARWQYDRSYVERLIAASQIFAYLMPNCHQTKPDQESQIRPLIGLRVLPPMLMEAVWMAVVCAIVRGLVRLGLASRAGMRAGALPATGSCVQGVTVNSARRLRDGESTLHQRSHGRAARSQGRFVLAPISRGTPTRRSLPRAVPNGPEGILRGCP